MKPSIIIGALMCATVAMAQQNGSQYADYQSFGTYRVGGYGDMVAAFKDYGTNRFYGHSEGNARTHRSTVSIPRFVLAGDCKLGGKWVLGAEIEFESGGTGSAYELENTENGEYELEVEKGGEVALEQFHLTRLVHRSFNVRAGHLIVPVGQNNAHHEPVNYFGTVRPEGETTIIPNTWHSTGLELFGELGKGYARFQYQCMVVAGLNANFFDRNHWAGLSNNRVFEEDNFTQPGYAVRLDYTGVPRLRVGGSFYYCKNIGDNSDKEQTYKGLGSMPVRIWSADAEYKCRVAEMRGNVLAGSLTNADALGGKNNKLSNKSPYSRVTPVAHKAVSYAAEAGLRVKGLVARADCPDIVPFVRYEYYNPQEKGCGNDVMDDRLKTSMLVAGVNWRPLPNLVVKADYTTRSIGGGKYNSENEFAVGAAFVGWFTKK